jgi:hypothetical protein
MVHERCTPLSQAFRQTGEAQESGSLLHPRPVATGAGWSTDQTCDHLRPLFDPETAAAMLLANLKKLERELLVTAR